MKIQIRQERWKCKYKYAAQKKYKYTRWEYKSKWYHHRDDTWQEPDAHQATLTSRIFAERSSPEGGWLGVRGGTIWLKHALGPIYMESNFCELFHFLLYIASGHFLLYTACGHVHCTVYIVHCTGWMERGEIKTAWITSSCCHLTQRIWLRNKKEKQNRKGSNWSSSAWLCYDDSIREYQFIQHRKVNHKISIHATYM